MFGGRHYISSLSRKTTAPPYPSVASAPAPLLLAAAPAPLLDPVPPLLPVHILEYSTPLVSAAAAPRRPPPSEPSTESCADPAPADMPSFPSRSIQSIRSTQRLLQYQEPWSECVDMQPTAVADVLVVPAHVKGELVAWMRTRLAGGQGRTALFLSGPGGCGKRTLVRTVAHALGAECVEPHVLTLEDVYAAVMDISLPFTLGSRQAPRVFLFAGVDGFMTTCDATAKTAGPTLDKLLAYIQRRNLHAPPCVFTVQGYPGRTGRAIRTSPAVDRLACYRIEPSRHRAETAGVGRVLSFVCGLARVPDLGPMIMAGFDGDIKQALLRLELAIRCGSSSLCVATTSKDTEVADAFDGARIILNTDACTRFDNLADIALRFGNMETVLRSTYLEGVDSIHDAAAAAVAWSAYAGSVFRHPALAAGTLALGLRFARGVPLRLGTLPYDRRSVHFDSKADLLREFRDGSPQEVRARVGTVGKTCMLLPPPHFVGAMAYHSLAAVDCLDMLALLKVRYNQAADGCTFAAAYGVSSHFLSTYESGLEGSDAVEQEYVVRTPAARTPARKRGRVLAPTPPPWPKWRLGCPFPAWWEDQVAAALSTPA